MEWDKNTKIIVAVIVVIVVIAAGAGIALAMNNNDSSQSTYKVTYDANGGTVEGKDKVTLTTNTFTELSATYADHEFGGWYADKECTGTKISDGTKVTKDMTVYAKWTLSYTFKISGISTHVDAFSIIAKDGTHVIEELMPSQKYVLPDNGKTRLITNTGVTDISVVKNADNEDCLKFKYKGECLFTMFYLDNANTVKYGVEGNQGYVEFTYNKSIDSNILVGEIVAKYKAGDGTLPGEVKSINYHKSFTVVAPDVIGLTPPIGKAFEGWYSDADLTKKVEIGTVLVPMDKITLYPKFV